MSAVMLEVEASHRLGAFTLEAGFQAGAGVTALFGPSGAGKSSLIGIIAGLIRPDRGRIRLNGTILLDRSAGVFVPARHRRIGYVFQDARLFPHLSVRQNLLYGHRLTPRAERFITLDEVVTLLGLEIMLGRRPGLLSGGEKQRVAIGRALLTSPRLLLMDEPLASLDEARRDEILPYLERLRDRARMPIIYVSHNRAEIERLASLVILLENGRVTGIQPAGRDQKSGSASTGSG